MGTREELYYSVIENILCAYKDLKSNYVQGYGNQDNWNEDYWEIFALNLDEQTKGISKVCNYCQVGVNSSRPGRRAGMGAPWSTTTLYRMGTGT